MSALGATAITALGAIGAAGINAASQARTNAQNRQQAEYAFMAQQRAIREANEYNSPAQQVLRMKAAGLNPSLAYGSDGAMVGNQSDIPSYSPIPAEAPNVGSLGSALAESVRTGIEVRDLERRNNLAVAEIANRDANSFLAMTQGVLNEAQTKETLDLLGYRIENLESSTQLNWEQVLETRQRISNMKDEKKEILSRVKLNEAQIKQLSAYTDLTDIQVYSILAKLPHEISNMDSQTAFNYVQCAEGREMVKKIAKETSHIGFIENLDARKYNFDVKTWNIEQEKWAAEYRQEAHLATADAITKVICTILGFGMLRNNQVLPPKNQSSPIYVPKGTSAYGETYGSYR